MGTLKKLLVLSVLLAIPATSWAQPPWWRPQDLNLPLPVVPGPWNGGHNPPSHLDPIPIVFTMKVVNTCQYGVNYSVNGKQWNTPSGDNAVWQARSYTGPYSFRVQWTNSQGLFRDIMCPAGSTLQFLDNGDGLRFLPPPGWYWTPSN